MHFPARRSKRDLLKYTGLLPVVAVLLAARCNDDDVARIDILPGIVTTAPDKPFLLSVRLTNGRGELMPEEGAAAVGWAAGSPLLSLSPNRGVQTTAILKAAADGPITITATLDGVSGSATISKSKPGESFVMDWGTAEHSDGERPTLLLVDGPTPSGMRSDTLIAFVGGGPLDEFRLSDDGGEVTVFSPGHALQRMKVPWIDDCDLVQAREGGTPYATEIAVTPCRPTGMGLTKAASIKLHAWTLVPAEDPAAVVNAELAEARRRLANGWTGLTLDLESPIELLDARTIVLDIREELGGKCLMGTEEFSVIGQLAAIEPRILGLVGPDKVTIVYAQKLVPPGSDAFVPSSYRGYTCQWDKSFGTIALIAWDQRAGTTLLHELGHAIGPWVDPPYGHTETMYGFDGSNLMWGWHAAVPAPRQTLTLGQAFRLALDGDAFNYRTLIPHPDPICAGQNEGIETPCPRISKDLIKR